MAKHVKRQPVKKSIVLLLAIFCALTVGGTTAYLLSAPAPETNTFDPAKVTCTVEETFENGVKADVGVRNTGNIPAFLRATVVINWVDADGKIAAATPMEGADYTVTWGTNGWRKGDDGFWYYTAAVSPHGRTADLIEQAQPISTPDGYTLRISIVASAIQAAPPAAAQDAWGVTVNGNTLIP